MPAPEPRRVGLLSLDEAIAAGIADVGAHTYGGATFHVWSGPAPRVSIGAYTSIATGVHVLCGGNHHVEWVTTFPLRIVLGLEDASRDNIAPKGITIGNDVWIASGATLLDGVTIGDGAVVAAQAVVTRDVRPYAVVAGSPAREVRRRFDDETVQRLLDVAWWNWPEERVVANVDVLCSERVDELVALSDTDDYRLTLPVAS